VSFIIRVLGASGTVADAELPTMGVNNCFVKDCDIEAFNGRGSLRWTQTRDNAKRFATLKDALTYYRQASLKKPLRDDGRPNRPLTAFTVAFEQL
jgi:hypothetical protein